MSESPIKKRLMLCLSQVYGVVILNYPVGTFFAGKVLKTIKGVMHLLGGRAVKCGQKGMPDLWGWKRTVITPDMVGRVVAVLVAVEVKDEDGKLHGRQPHVLARLEADGALSGVARCVDDLIPIMTKLEAPMSNFALRLDPELHALLAQKAKSEGVSLNQYVLFALSQAVKVSTKNQRVSVEGFEELFEAEEQE